MRVSGWGLLSPMLVMWGFVVAGVLVMDLHRGPLKLLLFTLIVLAAAAANHLLALRLNSEQTPQGRVWHLWHTAMGVPMQSYTVIIVVLLMAFDSYIVGKWTSSLVGWLTFPGIIAAMALAIAVYGRLRRRGALTDKGQRRRPPPQPPSAVPRSSSGTPGPQAAGDKSFDPIVNEFFAGVARSPSAAPAGDDLEVDCAVAATEAASGATKEIRYTTEAVCEDCGGSGDASSAASQTCGACDGRGSHPSFVGDIVCRQCDGSGTVVTRACQRCSGQGRARATRTVTFKIPLGVADGTRLRLAGHGQAGIRGRPSGHLYVHVRIQADPPSQQRPATSPQP